MYYFEETVAEVADQMGIRALLGQTVMDFATPDNPQNSENAFEAFDRMVVTFKGHSRIKPVMCPHAPYTCSDETIQKTIKYAAKSFSPIHIHVSETRSEVEESFKKYNKSPVKRLLDLGATQVPLIFAHCVHIDDEDIEILSDNKIGVIHNPESNMKIGVGVSPIAKLLKENVLVGIGTDGAASNNDLSIIREMDSATKLQKSALSNSSAMTAAQSLSMGTSLGAKALGIDYQVGTIEVGKRADIIGINTNFAHLNPIFDPVSQIVYSCSGLEVDTTVCDGSVLMENSVIKGFDLKSSLEELSHFRKLIIEQL